MLICLICGFCREIVPTTPVCWQSCRVEYIRFVLGCVRSEQTKRDHEDCLCSNYLMQVRVQKQCKVSQQTFLQLVAFRHCVCRIKEEARPIFIQKLPMCYCIYFMGLKKESSSTNRKKNKVSTSLRRTEEEKTFKATVEEF